MRQRRSSRSSEATTTNGGVGSGRLSVAPAAATSSVAAIVTLVSVILGFIVSTCALLLVWSSQLNHIPRDAVDVVGDVNQIQYENLLHWEWHRYNSFALNKTHVEAVDMPKHLIVQIATSDNEQVLEITSRVNRAYAKKWKLDYAQVTLHEVFGTTSYEYHSIQTTQYISVLRDLLKIGRSETSVPPRLSSNETIQYPYDLVWIFSDPSMMPVDFEKSIFVDRNEFLVTSISQHGTDENLLSGRQYSNMNEEALLWNLNHPRLMGLLNAWGQYDNLQEAVSRSKHVSARTQLWNEILDDIYTIYHFPFGPSNENTSEARIHKREDTSSTAGPNRLQMRTKSMIKLQSVADLVCFRYFPSCDVL